MPTASFDGQKLVNLTRMWEAAGKPKDKDPYHWGRLLSSASFIASLASVLNWEKSRVWNPRRGRHTGAELARLVAVVDQRQKASWPIQVFTRTMLHRPLFRVRRRRAAPSKVIQPAPRPTTVEGSGRAFSWNTTSFPTNEVNSLSRKIGKVTALSA